jgi:hypothetical protein
METESSKKIRSARDWLVGSICLIGILILYINNPNLIYSVSDSDSKVKLWNLIQLSIVKKIGIYGLYLLYSIGLFICIRLFIINVKQFILADKQELLERKNEIKKLPDDKLLTLWVRILINLCYKYFSTDNTILFIDKNSELSFKEFMNKELNNITGYKDEKEYQKWINYAKQSIKEICNNNYYYYEVIDERAIDIIKKWEYNPGFSIIRKAIRDIDDNGDDFHIINRMSKLGFDKEWLRKIYEEVKRKPMKPSQNYWFSKKKDFKPKKRLP